MCCEGSWVGFRTYYSLNSCLIRISGNPADRQHRDICNYPSRWRMVDGRRLFLLLLLQIPCQGHCESVTCYHQYQYPQLNVGKHEVPVPKCQLGDGPVLGGASSMPPVPWPQGSADDYVCGCGPEQWGQPDHVFVAIQWPAQFPPHGGQEVRLGTGSAHSARSFLGRFQGQG